MATFGEQSLFPLMQQVPEFVSRTAYHAARVMKFAVTHMQACNGERLSSKMHLRKVQMENVIALSCKDYGVALAGA